MKFINRKSTRLKNYNYSSSGAYFITICTKDRKQVLSKVVRVGDGVLDVPKIILSDYGIIAEKYIKNIDQNYNDIHIDKYIIMPDHIHLLICITYNLNNAEILLNGTSRTPSPTNEKIPRMVSTFKRFCNKEYGHNIWQRSYNDHVVRNEADYQETWKYIDGNPYRWLEKQGVYK